MPGLRFRHLRRSLTEPRWLGERIRKRMRRRFNERRRQGFQLATHADQVVSWEKFAAQALSLSATALQDLERQAWTPQPDPGDDTPWESRDSLLRLIGLIVLATQPAVVVETGVERGYSSATWLANMRRIGKGRLHSIDLPRTDLDDPLCYTGQLVPEGLRNTWNLVLGPSRKVLRPLLEELGEIDVFLHDADHAYSAQMEEYRTAWPFIRKGGLLVSDDVDNAAFSDFGAEVHSDPWLLPRHSFGDAIGVIRK